MGAQSNIHTHGGPCTTWRAGWLVCHILVLWLCGTGGLCNSTISWPGERLQTSGTLLKSFFSFSLLHLSPSRTPTCWFIWISNLCQTTHQAALCDWKVSPVTSMLMNSNTWKNSSRISAATVLCLLYSPLALSSTLSSFFLKNCITAALFFSLSSLLVSVCLLIPPLAPPPRPLCLCDVIADRALPDGAHQSVTRTARQMSTMEGGK